MKINFFAAARSAAGIPREEISLAELAGGQTVGDLSRLLSSRHTGRTPSGMTLERVLTQCSFLVNGESAELSQVLAEDDRVDVMPPFAGG
ncbi:MoaD/ThiS family protein [Rothia aerolata]|uniref:MoaD/ThiS family protein n=1 Tax=Rothia aerolata TaxID=1812262 RepID=UPI0016680167|nr:MoaD/ThiS family protein [Rothia aerolata]